MHLISLCIPFYSHLKAQKSLIEFLVAAGHQVTIVTHPRLSRLVEEMGAALHPVDWMESFLDDTAIQQANGIAYTAAMLYETATRLDEMTSVVSDLHPDGIIFDSATRRGKIIGLRLGLPTLVRSAMYPPLYQYRRTGQIRSVLLRDMLRAPRAFVKIGQAITTLIFDHKPADYDELYTRLYDDNDIHTYTAIPSCMMQDHDVKNLHIMKHHGLEVEKRITSERSWLREYPKTVVYVSLGSLITIDAKILQTLERVAGVKYLFVVATGPEGASGKTSSVTYKSFLPQKEILDYTDLCITHGGINTVIECMARRVPMLCVPYLTDQHMYAQQVQRLGVGIVQSKGVLRNTRKLMNALKSFEKIESYEGAYDQIDLYKGVEVYKRVIEWFEDCSNS